MIRYGRDLHQRKPSLLRNKENVDLNIHDSLATKKVASSNISKPNLIKKASEANTVCSENYLEQEKPIDLQRQYSTQILEDYSDSIFKQLSIKENVDGFLENHNISAFLRAKMVDWMIEVLSSYKMSEESFFRSVALMDTYLKKQNKKNQTKDIHLLGISCMFIAMKYEQIHPLRLSLISEKIARNKFSKGDIMRKQSEIIKVLDFSLEFPTVYEIIKFLQYSIEFPEKQAHNKKLSKILLYLTKLSMFKPEIAELDINLLGGAVYYAGLKLLAEQPCSDLYPELYLSQISSFGLTDPNLIKETTKKIMNAAKQFKQDFPILSNLHRFNSIE